MLDRFPCDASNSNNILNLLNALERDRNQFDIDTLMGLIHQLAEANDAWRLAPEIMKWENSPSRQEIINLVYTEDAEACAEYLRVWKKARPFSALSRFIASCKRFAKIRLWWARSLSFSRKEKRDVVFVFDGLDIGGAERALVQLLNLLASKGYAVDLFLIKGKKPYPLLNSLDKKVSVIPLSTLRRRSYATAVNYANWISPDFMLTLADAKRYVQYVHTDLASVLHLFPRRRYSSGYKKCDRFICVSEGARKSLIELFPFTREKARVVYNPYDLLSIDTKKNETPHIQLTDDRLNVVTVARLHEAKGFPRAIRAMAQVIREGIDFRWYVVGDGPERERLESLIDLYGLRGRFILLGSMLNPFPVLAQADIAALVSHYEGFGLSVLEAKRLGLPVLVTNFLAAPETVTHAVDGYIVSNSESGIVSGLRALLTDERLRKTLADNARVASSGEGDRYRSLDALTEYLFTRGARVETDEKN